MVTTDARRQAVLDTIRRLTVDGGGRYGVTVQAIAAAARIDEDDCRRICSALSAESLIRGGVRGWEVVEGWDAPAAPMKRDETGPAGNMPMVWEWHRKKSSGRMGTDAIKARLKATTPQLKVPKLVLSRGAALALGGPCRVEIGTAPGARAFAVRRSDAADAIKAKASTGAPGPKSLYLSVACLRGYPAGEYAGHAEGALLVFEAVSPGA